MAATWADIANSALTKIGQSPIMDLNDANPTAEACLLRYGEVRDIVLRSHTWSCASTRVALSPLSVFPPFGFKHYFQLPTDYLRKIEIVGDPAFEMEGRRILTDSSVILLRYVRRVDSPAELDPLCAEAMAYYLAYDLTYRIVQAAASRDSMLQGYKFAISKAKTVDSQEKPNQTVEANTFLEARN